LANSKASKFYRTSNQLFIIPKPSTVKLPSIRFHGRGFASEHQMNLDLIQIFAKQKPVSL
jgi:hypothetical protein